MVFREVFKEYIFIKVVYFFFFVKVENSFLCNYYFCFIDEEGIGL